MTISAGLEVNVAPLFTVGLLGTRRIDACKADPRSRECEPLLDAIDGDYVEKQAFTRNVVHSHSRANDRLPYIAQYGEPGGTG